MASLVPELSVVVGMVSDAEHLQRCLTALSHQVNPPSMEVIVAYDSDDDEIKSLQSQYQWVQFYPVRNPFPHDHRRGSLRNHLTNRVRAVGLGKARGRIVALLEDHGCPDKHWAAEIVKEHEAPHAAIGGAMENGGDKVLAWAVYYCDFARYEKPFQAGPAFFLSDANMSYKRRALELTKDLWQDTFHETAVNGKLRDTGETLWLTPEIVVYQHREKLGLGHALKERYAWGRYYAGNRAREERDKRWFYLLLSPALPFLIPVRKLRDAYAKKRSVGTFLQAFPLIVLLTLFWSLGELVGYLTAQPNPFSENLKEENALHQLAPTD